MEGLRAEHRRRRTARSSPEEEKNQNSQREGPQNREIARKKETETGIVRMQRWKLFTISSRRPNTRPSPHHRVMLRTGAAPRLPGATPQVT
jgi:hypothetical protein